jgi:peptidoglycan/LPS O-acetylase OafA/YrhL
VSSSATTGTRVRATHVHEVDVVRVLTFACVIAVHTLAVTNAATNPFTGGIAMLLHFTRESFFWLTGFVLVHQYGRRHLHVGRFYRRRLLVVGVPYVAWSLIYTVLQRVDQSGRWNTFWSDFGRNLAFGQAWYHLYFVLVSLQIYLLFPVIAALLRATARHHVALLVCSAAVQLVTLVADEYLTPWPGWTNWLTGHQDALVWNYQFWVLLGAVVAYHLESVRAWLDDRSTPVMWAIGAVFVVVVAVYVGRVAAGTAPAEASVVLQPVMLPWAMAAIAGLLLLGTVYARNLGGTWQRVVEIGSDRSFGIFLVHPLGLWLLLWVGDGWVGRTVPNPALTIVAYVVVVVASVIATEVMRRSPLSLPLTGRPMLHRAVTKATTPAGQPVDTLALPRSQS